MKNNSLVSFLLSVILALGVGCARKADDAKISGAIQDKFSQDSGLSSKRLAVQAEGGVVTLSGTVDNEEQRQAAARQAATIAGVRTVINNLQVGGAPSAVASAAPDTATNSPDSTRSVSSPPVMSKTSAGKKRRKANAPEDSSAAGSSRQDSASAMNSSVQPAPNAAPQQAPPAAENAAPVQTPPPPPAPRMLIIDQGTPITVRLIDPIDSEKNQTGDTFHATLNAPLTSDGEEAVPAGVELVGHLVEVKSAGKFAGQSAVVLQLDKLSWNGKTYTLQTDQYRKQGKSRGKNTAEKVGGGAIIGGIIGAIAGGGKGAAIGTAAGAGVGGGVQAAGKGQQIKLPSETVLNFVLQAPITVVQGSNLDTKRQKLGSSQ
jgi:BON domain